MGSLGCHCVIRFPSNTKLLDYPLNGRLNQLLYCCPFLRLSSRNGTSCHIDGNRNPRTTSYLLTHKFHKNALRTSRLNCSVRAEDPFNAGTNRYEFVDSAVEVELRITCPEGIIPSIDEVIVNVQERSILVAVENVKKYSILLSINRLYGQINPAETIWYIDENEIVVSLKKALVDKEWPDVIENWQSLSTGLSGMLKGISIYLVGDSSEVNWAVARELALGLKYAPLQTKDLLEQATRRSLQYMVTDEGGDSVAEAEAAVLKSINFHVRVVVATLGGDIGASSRSAKWKSLYAGFTIWLCSIADEGKALTGDENLKAKEALNKVYTKADVAVSIQRWHEDTARNVAEACFQALKNFLDSEPGLPEKKSLYVRMGCRGDWPDIMPPGWETLEL